MGLLEDILGFAGEGFKKVGDRAAASTKQQADMVSRVAAGKPMGGMGDLLSTVSGINPMGGVVKTAQPEMQGLLKTVQKWYPKMWAQLEKDPREVLANVMPNDYMPGMRGSVRRMSPDLSHLNIRQDQLGQPGLMGTVVHELQHTLNQNRIAGTSTEDAGTIGLLLHDLLPMKQEAQASLMQRVKEYNKVIAPHGDVLDEFPIIGNQWKSLSAEQKAGVTSSMAPVEQNASVASQKVMGYHPDEPYGDFLHRVMMDEGLAHVAQGTAMPGVSQGWMDLAKKLGVGIEGGQ